MAIVLDQTLAFLVQFVQDHPGALHSDICTRERDTAKRRSAALAMACARGLLVRSAKRPWSYTVKQ
jgi:hypothetical protein